MWTQAKGVDFDGGFVIDPRLDHVGGENVSLEKEGMILLQRRQRFGQRARGLRDFARFFRFEILNVNIKRLAGIELVLNSVDRRHEHR